MVDQQFPPPPAPIYPPGQQKMEVEVTRISQHVVEALKEAREDGCNKCQRALMFLEGYKAGSDKLDDDYPGELVEKLEEILS